MPLIRVKSEARDALRQHSIGNPSPEFDPPAFADGTVEMLLRTETISRLRKIQLRGESLSDTILRLALTAGRRPN